MSVDRKELQDIRTFPSLVRYLRDEMGWPIDTDDFEELTFEYTAEELGIDTTNAAKIQDIKRLRPLSANQPWGIFFVKFEPKRLPVVALRRILSCVALKKRSSSNSDERVAWAMDDLLFISNYGEGDQRQISFAHFSRDTLKDDLPTLKVLGWDNLDTPLHLDHVAELLTERLAWPDDEADVALWRESWGSAFILRPREVITTSKVLAVRLAELARAIRDRIQAVLSIETENGPVTRLMKAFQKALIHDLDSAGFADMYAQTIAYGLLSARITNPEANTADDLASQLPVTNPFLKELMEAFLHVGGRKGKADDTPGIDFDELGVGEVVELLDNSNMEAIVRDFGDKNPQEDPVIHFYELFLKEYDAKQKAKRGVFYTPRPVVSYIVRSVDELLRTEFGLEDGLADTTTWGEIVERNKELTIPNGTHPRQTFVRILDPATGTGTFLVEVIELIHHRMVDKWMKKGHSEKEIEALWNCYVPEHLLPRLYGYELLMAPYSIAHLKIGLKLYETGYRFESNERAHIYLTNALEPASDEGQQAIVGMFSAFAHEAEAVNEVKRNMRFTVVIGNPPYSNFGQLNKIPFILNLLEDYKRNLDEKKLNLDDDFIKFFRFGHWSICEAGVGLLALITNNAYLEGITHRRMRELIITDFDIAKILNLHGSATKQETDSEGRVDKNVFDIKQGVCIGIFVKTPWSDSNIAVSNLLGSRESKYAILSGAGDEEPSFTSVSPTGPYFLIQNTSASALSDYQRGLPLSEVFQYFQSPIQTKRDHLTIHFSENEIEAVLDDLISASENEIRKKYHIAPDGRDWTLQMAIADVRKGNGRIQRVAYKPFDFRFTYYTGKTRGFLAYPRTALMRHLLSPGGRAFVFKRQAKEDPFGYTYFFVIACPCSEGLFAIDPRGREFVAPMQLVPDDPTVGQGCFAIAQQDTDVLHNFTSDFLRRLAIELDLAQQPNGLPESLNISIIFHYIYAVLSSLTYRKRFEGFLHIDYPRLPFTKDLTLFRSLALLGQRLADLHILETDSGLGCHTTWTGATPIIIESVTHDAQTVWLDKKRTKGIHGVSIGAWDYRIGGYKVCEKWLQQRKGRTLSEDDLIHFGRMVSSVETSVQIVSKIDYLIESYGGWGKAFNGGTFV